MTILIANYGPTTPESRALAVNVIKATRHKRIVITNGCADAISHLREQILFADIIENNQESMFYKLRSVSADALDMIDPSDLELAVKQYSRLIPPFCEFSPCQAARHFLSVVLDWMRFLRMHEVSVALFVVTPHVGSDFAVYCACLACGIKVIVGDGVCLYNTDIGNTHGYFWQSSKGAMVNSDRRKYITNSEPHSRFVLTELKKYARQLFSRKDSLFSLNNNSLYGIKKSLKNLSTLEAKKNYIQLIKNLYRHDISSQLDFRDNDCVNVICFLSIDPEATFNPCSGFYQNSREWINAILNFLGSDVFILFKEHPFTISASQADGLFLHQNANSTVKKCVATRYRGEDFLSALKLFNNHRYIFFGVDEFRDLSRGSIYLTNSGNIAVEAALTGNPVIIGGNMHKIPLAHTYGIWQLEEIDDCGIKVLREGSSILKFSAARNQVSRDCMLSLSKYLCYNPFYGDNLTGGLHISSNLTVDSVRLVNYLT